jgi:hypothetical protein
VSSSVDDLYPDRDDPVDPVEAQPASASLSSRMAQRQEELNANETERFPLPGWDDMLEVELRALGYRAIRKTMEDNSRIRDEATRELCSFADQLVKATVGFHEIPEGGGKSQPIEDDWVDLARRAPNCPTRNLTPRVAVLFLVGEKRIHFLVQDWAKWAKTVRKDVDRAVMEDFEGTG